MSEEHEQSHFQDHAEAVLNGADRPKNQEELQALMIEEYFMRYRESIGTGITLQEFTTDNALQLEAVKHWKFEGMAEAFRKMLSDKSRTTSLLDSTLDDVTAYIEHN